MKKITVKKMLSSLLAAVLILAMFTGCGASTPAEVPAAPAQTTVTESTNTAAGTLLLSVNPEIEVEYDKGGLVLEIEGINDDGRNIVTNFGEYKGRATDQVVNELVQKIYESGYFEKTVGGNPKNIVIKLEQGSTYPNDTFLENVAQGVRDTVDKIGVKSKPMTVKESDYSPEGYIGLEKAKELVLSQLGLNEATFIEREYELDDGVYELEFKANGVEYEYEVSARTGKVLEADFDLNDDWDDNDRYDDDRDDDWDDRYDDWDDRYDDRDDRYDDWNDRYDDRDDRYDDWNDRYDDRDDRYDDWDD